MSQSNISQMMEIDPRKLTQTQLNAIRKHQEDSKLFEMYDSILEAATRRKNILTLSEFKKYEPIYKKVEVKDIGNPNEQRRLEELQNLSNEFYNRVDPYNEITVVDDYNPDKVIMVLPKIYTSFNPLKQGHESSLMEFDRLTNIPYRNDLKEEGVNKLITAIALSQDITFDPTLKEKEQQRFTELSEKILNSDVQNNTNTLKNINNSNITDLDNTTADWDFDDE